MVTVTAAHGTNATPAIPVFVTNPTAAPEYTDAFFDKIESGSLASARRVVPTVMAQFAPMSVVDVGCGAGVWLSVFWSLGCRVTGVDGSYVRPERRLVENFVAWDLAVPLPDLPRHDLAVSLEVAEHLPHERADGFVDDLVRLADRVLFSAAIPGQGGDNHINEQPHEYWIERFEARGFAADTSWRRRFACDEAVAWWYRQNMIVFEKHR